jgi:hypothetical protein
MLKDRIVLLENEINKLMTECSALYQSIAIRGDESSIAVYDGKLAALAELVTERRVIADLIARGAD